MDFRWIEWNEAKVHSHGVTPEEVEEAFHAAKPPYPRRGFDDRWYVWAQSSHGRYLQVVYLKDPEGTLFVIHARPLEDQEKRRFRKQRR